MQQLLRPDIVAMEPYTPIVPFEVLSARLGRPVAEIIKLDANENPYGPSPKALAALAEGKFFHIYPDPESNQLREALVGLTGVPKEYLLAGAGADELIDLVARAIINPGDGLINCPPSFGMYPFTAHVNSARLISVPRRADFSLDVEGIIAAASHSPTPKLIYLCSPNNPDGSTISDTDLRRILALPLLVVLDEAYIEFSEQLTVNSEQWTVNSEQWTVNSEQWTVNSEQSPGSIHHSPFTITHSPFTIHHSPLPSLQSPVSQSLSLPVSQSLSLPVSQSLSLPVSQSPSLPVSQSPSLPVSQSPSLPVSLSPASRITWVREHDNLVVLRTFSKLAGLAGLRVGYGAFPLWLIEQLWKIKQPYNVNVAATVAALASLEDIEWLREKRDLLVKERERLAAALRTIPYLIPTPSQANFILCQVVGKDALALKLALERAGILVRYFAKPGLENCIRVSVARPQDTDRLIEALGMIHNT
ncbi:MAG: aminotransferase class I/II-fold pyridoxal phosphate-dependent enzyme [Candidatus Promineifilaceae bacterium]